MMRKTFLILLILSSFTVFGQEKTKEDLLKHLKKINYWAEYNRKNPKINALDSLVKENNTFKKLLLEYTAKQQTNITNEFKSLQKQGLIIASSADKKFRIYSWDTLLGGSTYIFDNVYQYQDDKKTYSRGNVEQKNRSGGYFSKISVLNTAGKTYYLGFSHHIIAGCIKCDSIRFFKINQKNIDLTPSLIKTNSGLKNSIGLEFNSCLESKKNQENFIQYDAVNKIIKIPITLKSNRKVSDQFTNYHFNGQVFEGQQ